MDEFENTMGCHQTFVPKLRLDQPAQYPLLVKKP
jgi:hypothetical protein